MSQKVNKRIFNQKSMLDSNLSYKELKQLLAQEKRIDNKEKIKEILYNKIFAKVIFAMCIGLNILFIVLGVLNYMGILG